MIHVQQLTKSFGAQTALDRLNLNIPAGTIFGLLGPNGSGKTTTIRLLLGLLEPTSGQAEVCGFAIRTHARRIRQQCGVLLEHNGLYLQLSALANLEWIGRVYGLEAAIWQARAQHLLQLFGLWERRHEQVEHWSKGMRQKLALARALLPLPQLVFLDEPTSGLDPLAARELRQQLLELVAQSGTTLFLTTHNLQEAERMCDLVGVLHKGRLVALGPPQQLINPAHEQTIFVQGQHFTDQLIAQLNQHASISLVTSESTKLVFHKATRTELNPILQAILAHGGQIQSIHTEKPSLEAAFLQLTTCQTEKGVTRVS